MSQSLIKILRGIHFTYLALLPGLAFGSVGLLKNSWEFEEIVRMPNWLHGIALILSIFGIVIYLDIILELTQFPQKIGRALILTLIVPMQVLITTLISGQSAWGFLTLALFTEGTAITLLLAKLIIEKIREKDISIGLVLFFLISIAPFIIIALPITVTLLGERIFPYILLATGSISGAIVYDHSIKNTHRNEDATPYIVIGLIGTFAMPWILLTLFE